VVNYEVVITGTGIEIVRLNIVAGVTTRWLGVRVSTFKTASGCDLTTGSNTKVNDPTLVTYLNRTPIFEWCAVRCGSKNGHQKDIMFLNETGVHAQKLLTILGSTLIIIRGGDYLVILCLWHF
jgi:hypothetical protein